MASSINRTPSDDKVITLPSGTEYQIFLQMPGVIDLTERMLLRLWSVTTTPKRKLELAVLIESYRTGAVAVGWRSAEPIYIRVIKESTGKPAKDTL